MDHLSLVIRVIEQTEDLYTHKPSGKIVIEDKIINDLGIDSLGRVTLFYELVHEANIDENSVDESICQSWVTISDIVNFLKDHSNG